MTKPGKIVIKDKVYFKPDFDCKYIQNIIKEYEASKQLIDVVNLHWRLSGIWTIRTDNGKYEIKNNQKCKAEITDNKATIVELIK